MSKEKLIKQIEHYQKDLLRYDGRALKYYTAYNYLMDHFEHLPDDIQKKIHKRLKYLGL